MRLTLNKLKARSAKYDGFSAIELLIVVALITVLAAISIPYFYSFTRAYKSEDEALKLLDNIREASQLALAKRRTFRMEVDLTANAILIIDENGPASAADDKIVKSIPLEDMREVRMEQIPTGVTRPVPPDFTDAVFDEDVTGHLNDAGDTIIGNNVFAARFRSDGSVVKADGLPLNTNLYLWPPADGGGTNPRVISQVRALTLYGNTGAVRYWKHNGTAFVPY